MGSDYYFYEQNETRKILRRYRKLPEELPESLRFAHLNPKVAALLASKERGQRLDNEDPFGDGMGKKSLLPDINAAFTNVRNQFDSAMSNDEDSQRYLFEEAKLSAAQVLQQLSRIIYFYDDLCQHVPRSLEYHLMSGYEEFTKDIVVVPRDWQTHTMKEQYAYKLQQQEAISEEEISDNDLTGRSRSRLQSERSSEVGSKMNIRKNKPKLGLLEVNEGIEPGARRSESRISLAPSQLRGHLDVGSISRVGSRRKGSTTAMANPLSYMQTINFQLSNKSFEDKGWIMLKGRQEEVDQNTVLEYCIARLQECMKDISNQRQKNLDQGHDKSVTVRYYGDSRKETLLKYRKSPVKPTSSLNIQKGGKPRIPSIIDECNEGKLLMQASHVDGSTVIYYPSGRPAIVYSAAGFGRPGYYTIVYEDELDSKMLACFTPSGRGVCYYENGVVRFLATEKGGHLTEENGKLIRKWKWPHSNVKITVPICFQINNHLMFRCVGQNQMTIVFSSQKESARFSVGPAPEADEYRPMEDTDQLLTAFTFSSKAAKDLMRIFAPKKQKKRSRKKKKKKQQEEQEKKDAESSKQVKFLSAMSTVPKLISGLRRMSLASRQEKPIETKTRSQSLQVESPIYSQLVKTEQSTVNDGKCKLMAKRISLTPDSQLKSVVQQKQLEELNKRAKSARQTKGKEIDRSIRGKRSTVRSVTTSKPSTSNKPTEIESKTSEEGLTCTSTSKQNSRINRESSQSTLATTTPSGFKAPNSILKNRQVRSVVVVSDLKTDQKEVRICKSAKSEASLLPSFEDTEKRVKSATTLAGQSYEGTERQKHSMHTYLQNALQGEKSSATSQHSESETEEFNIEPYSDYEKELSDMEVPHSVIDGGADVRREDSANSKSPIPILMVTSHEDVEDTEDTEECNGEKDINENVDAENTDENEDFPPDFTYRRQRGGCVPLITCSDVDATAENTDENEDLPPDFTYRRQRGGCVPLITCSDVDAATENTDENEDLPPDFTYRRQRGGCVPLITCSDVDATAENTDENEDFPPDFTYRRQRGGCVPLITCSDVDATVENTDENEDFPPDFTYNRQRGGCVPLITCSDMDATAENTDENKEVSKSKSKKDVDINKANDQVSEVDKQEKQKLLPSKKTKMTKMSEADKQEKQKLLPPKKTKMTTLMKSIMLFRKKNLAKKGIELTISESSSSGSYDSDSDSDDSQTSKSQSTEIIKLLQDFPEKVSYDIEAEKELARLQRKSRNLVDDWMEHYRIALGFKSPLLQSVEDTPRHALGKRNIKSAKSSNHLRQIRMAVLGLDFEEDDEQSPAKKKNRIPSAPLKGELADEIDEELKQLIAEKHQTVKFDESIHAAGDVAALSPSALNTLNRLTETASRRSARSKVSSARSSGSPSRQQPVPPAERVPSAASGSRSFCPLVIRQQRLNYDRPQCRCSRHHIPFMMDIELDDFISTETQENQLIVIMIVSSLKNIKNKVTNVDYDFYINKEGVPFHRVFPGITKAEEMLNEIYVTQNRNRTRPCVQSRMDMFRIFKYDINSAAEMSNRTQPLLMTRHNVVPGMFLIYCDGKLLFCDHIFNGYGNARKDFKKQVMKCRYDSIQGCYLPKDFRFSPSQGKSGLRSAWGGEIGGAGVDRYSSSGTVVDQTLQPIHRHTSTSSSSENSQPIQYDAVKSTNRRPFLPRIDGNQTGPGKVYPSESISNWLSTSQSGSKTSTFSTTTSYPNSLSELY